MLPQGAIGWFGKLPAQGDFVRAGVADPLVQRFAVWLEEASEACHRAGARPAAPVRFAFRPPGELRLLVGALRDSVDRAGRVFPMALFAAADARGLATGFPDLPAAWAGFLGAAEDLLSGMAGLEAAAFAERARRLPLPQAGDLAAAVEAGRGRDAGPAAPVLERLFGAASAGGHLYALGTFRTACGKVRGREPARAEVALDCPVASPGDERSWLELARRALGWPAPPPFLWGDGSAPRLLLCLGLPPAAALLPFGTPERDHPKIWPLRTAQPAAVEAARKALGPAAAELGRAGLTVGELIATLSR
jgi:type VI secretion system protein ImpM